MKKNTYEEHVNELLKNKNVRREYEKLSAKGHQSDIFDPERSGNERNCSVPLFLLLQEIDNLVLYRNMVNGDVRYVPVAGDCKRMDELQPLAA